MEAGEAFQQGQRTQLFEGFGIKFDSGMRGINTGAASSGFLGILRMRRAVGAEEKFRITGLDYGDSLLGRTIHLIPSIYFFLDPRFFALSS